jgi:RNA polymerase sigma-70 factor (ECF subfamily)
MSEAIQADDQDRSDMKRLAAGFDGALNDLMERHAPRLFNYLLRHLEEADANDLTQETFVRIYQNRAKYKSTHKFSTWLYTIATNLLRDKFRWQKRHPSVSLDKETDEGNQLLDVLPSEAMSPSESASCDERADIVRDAIRELPEDLRTAVILSEYEDKSHAEIGEILKCSAKAVEMRLYHARQQLRNKLLVLQ